MRGIVIVCLAPLILSASFAEAAVYRCVGPTRIITYTDLQCPPHHRQEDAPKTATDIIRLPPLSDSEVTLLETLEHERNTRARARQREQQNAAQRQKAEQAERQKWCKNRQATLEEINRRLRSGYRLQEADKLKHTRAVLREDIRRQC